MQKRSLIFCIALIIIGVISITVFYFFPRTQALAGVSQFGPLKLGGFMPVGGPGDHTFAPHKEIPPSKFYVTIVQNNLWCTGENCGLQGALVQTMGGWLQMTLRSNFPDIDEMVGLDLIQNKKITSLVFIGDHSGTIVGIYPNKNLKDVPSILQFHPDLADFSLLKGVNMFGSLKVGDISPLKPGDPTGYSLDQDSWHPHFRTHIPMDKKFYVFIFDKYLLERGYCAFVSCESRLDYPNGSYIEDLGGWFSSDGAPETARMFSLDPSKITKGEASLVVVTDQQGVIVALHPNAHLKDIVGILSQHKELADVEAFYAPKEN